MFFSFIVSYHSCKENSPQTLTLKGQWQGTGCTSVAFRLQKILVMSNSLHLSSQDRVDGEKKSRCPFPSAAKASLYLYLCREMRDQGENLVCNGGRLLSHRSSIQPMRQVIFSPAKCLSLPFYRQQQRCLPGLAGGSAVIPWIK